VTTVPPSLFVLDGTTATPTEAAVGPWSPDALHGGPVAALVVRAAEAVPAPGPFQVMRVTMELLRPVPLHPLTVTATLSRPGRNVQVVDVGIDDGPTPVVTARVLRIRTDDVAVPDHDHGPVSPPAPTGDVPDPPGLGGFLDAVDLRWVHGSWESTGPATLWGRLRIPVVAGETPTAVQQAVAVADFGNGVSRLLDFATHMFINPDLTVAFSRPPVPGWIGIEAVTRLSPHGSGQAESRLFDVSGSVGRAVQTLLVATRP
jgi:hypothetical protein